MAVLPRIISVFRGDQTVSLRLAAGAATWAALLLGSAVLSVPVKGAGEHGERHE